MAALHDSSLLMLVGGSSDGRHAGHGEARDEQSARIALVEYMKQICLGYEQAPTHVVATIDAALAVCQEWQSRPRGKNVPLPPPALRQDRATSEGEGTNYQPNPKSIAYTPCIPEPPSVLAMMAVRKVNNPPAAQP